MTIVISRLFDQYEQASQAVTDLESSGIPHSDISLVANNADNKYSVNDPNSVSSRAAPWSRSLGLRQVSSRPPGGSPACAPRSCARANMYRSK